MFRPVKGFSIKNDKDGSAFFVIAPQTAAWAKAASRPWLKGQFYIQRCAWRFPKARRELVLEALDACFGTDYAEQWAKWKRNWEAKNNRPLKTPALPLQSAPEYSEQVSQVVTPQDNETIPDPVLEGNWKASMRVAYERFKKSNERLATE